MKPADFLLYGATGYVGRAVANMAVKQGFKPTIAGRSEAALEQIAAELNLEYQVVELEDLEALIRAFSPFKVVLNCAGPFIYTYQPIVEACLRTGTHYLDITGELPVFQALADLDGRAQAAGVMLLPGVGFDVVPTDCLAVHLKNRLPSATHLSLAFYSSGPAGLPPGTQRTMIEMIPYGNQVRRDGQLLSPAQVIKTRSIDFGKGPQIATRITWGDVFTAWYSTGIPNIEDYLVLPVSVHKKMKKLNRWRHVYKLPFARNHLKKRIKPGPSEKARAQTKTHVWGEVIDQHGQSAVSRLHGPEAGVEWTGQAALLTVRKILTEAYEPGFQTAGKVYGADLVLECPGVTREDVG